MSDDEVRKKFLILTKDALEPQAQRAFVDRVESLQHETECGWLVGTFSHPTEI